MKYNFIVFGCQFNYSDSERIAAVLENLGYQKTLDQTEADLIVVVACSVRQSAIDRIYGLKRKFVEIRKTRPIVTILSGCVLDSDKLKMKNFFDIVLPITDLAKLPKLLKKKAGKLPIDYLKIRPFYQSNYQAHVPIMTGCNNFCTYCVVPYVRGREVSRPAADIFQECQVLINKGYKEIILLGQNVNSYRSHGLGFPKLLKMIDSLPGKYRLSFVTSHPKDLSDQLIGVIESGRHIIPYLHLPAQSGDNKILKLMNRRYNIAYYKNLIKKVRQAIPEIAISTDIIVGFPGETKSQFENTAKLFREVKFDMAYIAQYSPRVGTLAAKFNDNVSIKEKKNREKKLTNILKKTALKHNQRLVGQTVEVLVDSYQAGFCFGKTGGLKNIKFASDVDYSGEIVLVRVKDCYAWGLIGELPKVVIIVGTTSSGKTKLAVRLAKKFNGEIVSADSRQVYKGMDVGTGKDLAEYGRVPYHLIDVVSPKKQFTVADWQKLAYLAIDDILKRGKIPIVCGGTGLYISALTEGYQMSESIIKNHKSRIRLNKLTLKQLLSRLKKIDLETYKIIDQKNRVRVQRALEIYYETGYPKSAQPQNKKPAYNFLQLGRIFQRNELNNLIDHRLEHRLNQEGMIAEIKKLHKQGVTWNRLDEFGLEYRQVSRYLQGKIIYPQMVEELKNIIHRFAKRQMTWFKRDSKIRWIKDVKSAEKIVKDFL